MTCDFAKHEGGVVNENSGLMGEPMRQLSQTRYE